MNKPDQDTLLLRQLLDKYKFARPVPNGLREDILAAKKKNLVRVLKTVGAYSALHGLLISLYLAVKKAGIGIPVAKFIVSGIAVTAVTYGGYYAATALFAGKKETPARETRPSSTEEIRKQYKWVDQIFLYNGRTIEGAIISRGPRYRVLTSTGIVEIPRNQIKMVKPLKIEDASKN